MGTRLLGLSSSGRAGGPVALDGAAGMLRELGGFFLSYEKRAHSLVTGFQRLQYHLYYKMGDPNSRKKQALNRLRAQLKKKKESLADQFDFKMYIAFVFKDKRKKSALFEVSEVIPVMTNNYEENILKGVRDSSYSLESSIELLQKDVVQLHAPRYQSMRRDVIGCTQEMDFILWPRNDIEKIVCLLFSRWKGSDDEPFRPVQARFEFHHGDYEKQFLHVLSRKDKTGIVINNPNQSVFLFIDRQHLQTPKNKATIFKLCSICLYLPQEQLTHWAVGTIEEHLRPYMPE